MSDEALEDALYDSQAMREAPQAGIIGARWSSRHSMAKPLGSGVTEKSLRDFSVVFAVVFEVCEEDRQSRILLAGEVALRVTPRDLVSLREWMPKRDLSGCDS